MSPISLLLAVLMAPVPSAIAPHTVQAGAPVQRVVRAMGTTLRIEVRGLERHVALAASEAAIASVEALESALSTWRQESLLSRVNRAPATPEGEAPAWIELTPQVGRILERAFHWRAQTAGAFDPTAGPLVRAWDLRGAGRQPSPAELSLALASCGPERFALDLPHRIARRNEHAAIEEGGFGKGAALDAAALALRNAGVQEASLDFGGQVLFLGTQDGATAPPSLAIAHPDRREEPVALLNLNPGSCATSGNSERGLTIHGERIGHLLDPRTGRPAPDFGSVTVWCPSALDADCLSTALYVLGPDAGLQLAEALPNVEAVFVVRAEHGLRLRSTRGLRPHLNTLDREFPIEWTLPLSPVGGSSDEPPPSPIQ